MSDTERDDIQKKWVKILEHHGAYWFHDGNPARPYAALASGKLSNFYVDCTPIVSRPRLCEAVARDLVSLAPPGFESLYKGGFNGSAYGAITLAYELTRQLGLAQAWYTVKGQERGEMVLDRFNFTSEVSAIVLAEDVITEFTSTRGSVGAIRSKAADTGVEAKILPYVFCIVNRSGRQEIDGFNIIALIIETRAKTWEPDHNPFTADGNELVRPVAYAKENLGVLTRAY